MYNTSNILWFWAEFHVFNQQSWIDVFNKNIKSQTRISLLFYLCHRVGIFALPTRPTSFDKHHTYYTSVIWRRNEPLMYIPTWWRIYQHGVIPHTYLTTIFFKFFQNSFIQVVPNWYVYFQTNGCNSRTKTLTMWNNTLKETKSMSF